jgi:hypothetical protein
MRLKRPNFTQVSLLHALVQEFLKLNNKLRNNSEEIKLFFKQLYKGRVLVQYFLLQIFTVNLIFMGLLSWADTKICQILRIVAFLIYFKHIWSLLLDDFCNFELESI